MLTNKFQVVSPNVKYTDKEIISNYKYTFTKINSTKEEVIVTPVEKIYNFKVERKVPKLG